MRKVLSCWLVVAGLLVAGSCAPTLPTYEVLFSGNTIDVPVDNIGYGTYTVVTDETNPYNILLVKDSPGAYHAVYLRCTHDAKPLDPTSDQVICPVCRSVYNLDGTVKNGPAQDPLSRFNTELSVDQTLVKINIESLHR